MRRSFIMFVTLFLSAVGVATAQQPVTTRDIVELSKAGLAEEILLALIEVHRPVFPVDIVTLKGLKDSGVAPSVIIAMIKSGRELPAVPPSPASVTEQTAHAVTPSAAAPSAAAPQVVYVERDPYHDPVPRVRYEERLREVVVPVPVYIPVRSRPIHRPEPVPAEPVYWGFGGKLRPDAWKPTAADVQKDARVPREPQKK